MMATFREAFRGLARAPRFAASVVSVLAVGIGLNVAVFAAVRAMLLAPLPYKNPEQLVRIWEANPSKGISRSRVSRGNYADWRRTTASFQSIEAFSPPSERIVSIAGEPEVIHVAMFTKDLAAMLGVEPLVRDESPHGRLLSYSYWQRRFGGDPSVVNRSMQQNLVTVPVMGVMPRGYDFPTGADAWSVMSFGHERGARNLDVVARLKPGVSVEQARAELQAIEANLARSYPTENAIGAEPSALLRSVLRRGLRLAIIGVAIGLAAALVLGRALQSTVAAAAADPIAMGVAVPALMLVTTIAATYRPARRAAAIDPLQLLKGE
jgi:putative ABC transport system permease protein